MLTLNGKEITAIIVSGILLWGLGYKAGHINGMDEKELYVKRKVLKFIIKGVL